MGFSMAIRAQLRSLMLHDQTLNSLLATGRKGDDDALLNALAVDPAVIGCRALRERIQLAVATNDQPFLKKLRRIQSSLPSQEASYTRLDAALLLLTFAKQLHKLNEYTAARLFIEETRLYPRSGKDPQRSLWRLIQRWKKDHATLIEKQMSS